MMRCAVGNQYLTWTHLHEAAAAEHADIADRPDRFEGDEAVEC